jgi:hypothetical protein
MGFLDNSGDIILDAVLTDTGRARLAKGDGTFRIAKFALGDDEIDYALYDNNNPSGSAYFDLQILQTPVLEAFTNNTANLNSKLISIARTNLLYLPTMAVNTNLSDDTKLNESINMFYVTVDNDTTTALNGVQGTINGFDNSGGSYVRVDQGLDTTEVSQKRNLDSDLVETQYIIELDTRLGEVTQAVDAGGGSTATISFIDDDQIASYYLSLGTDTDFVETIPIPADVPSPKMIIDGPLGTLLKFKILASIDLQTSTFLFTELGGTVNLSGTDYYYIDSNIRVTGATTGTRLDIPVRFIKKQ